MACPLLQPRYACDRKPRTRGYTAFTTFTNTIIFITTTANMRLYRVVLFRQYDIEIRISFASLRSLLVEMRQLHKIYILYTGTLSSAIYVYTIYHTHYHRH